MRKRILAGILLVVLLISFVSAENMFFVAVNDSVPLTLSGGETPFYQNGQLYVPRTAFGVSGLGVTPSYNPDNQTMVLFSRSKRLVFHLDTGAVTDENNQQHGAGAVTKGGMLYLPANLCASHFGFGVSLLTNSGGYRILRFTNGAQAYDDALFLQKSQNLIDYRVQQSQGQPEPTKPTQPTTPIQPPQPTAPVKPTQPTQPTQPEEEKKPDIKPATAYVAVEGAGGMNTALNVLNRNRVPAAYFLTAQEIRENPRLVYRILATGNTIGLTVPAGEKDVAAALADANAALHDLTQMKVLLVLVSSGQQKDAEGYCTILRNRAISADAAVKQDGGRCLVVLRGSVDAAVTAFTQAKITYRPLQETSPF